VARAESYLRAKFRVDPSIRLATIHQRRTQTDRTGRQADRHGPIAKAAQKLICSEDKVRVCVCVSRRQLSNEMTSNPDMLVHLDPI